ncbi:MAG: cupin-like domain-containing protein [Cyanobacteria bacterium J06642_2]
MVSVGFDSEVSLGSIEKYASLGPSAGLFSDLVENLIVALRSFSRNPYLLVEFEEKFLFPRLENAGSIESHHGVIDILRIPAESIKSFEVLNILRNFPVPIVLEGLASESEAVRNWTPNFFKENYGAFEVLVDYPRRQEAKRAIPLSEVVDEIQSGSDCGHYVANVSDIFLQYPELETQLPIETIRHDYLDHKKLAYIHLFMGGPGTGTDFHCANGVNFFVNIHGRKEWQFVNPKHSAWMYPVVNVSGVYGSSAVDFRKSQEEHRQACPLYEQIPVYKTILNPGDVLVNPPWWWHAIRNVTPSSIGCATRWLVPTKPINPFYTFLTLAWCRPAFLKSVLSKTDSRLSDANSRKNHSDGYEMVMNNRKRFWLKEDQYFSS